MMEILLLFTCLLLFPGQAPGVVRLRPVLVIDDQLFIRPILILDEEYDLAPAIIDHLNGAIDRGDLISQEMPPKVRFAGLVPTITLAPVQNNFHNELLLPNFMVE
jgi:hypothetical protein